jgi:hypothetical protein
MVPLTLFIANKTFGISSSLRHICAACMPGNIDFFKYNWKKELWSLFFVSGVLLGGVLTNRFLSTNTRIDITEKTKTNLSALGISDFNQYMPVEIFNWNNLLSIQGILFIVIGGFMVGFGARWALTGACPGPLFALVGNGYSIILVSLISALFGTWIYGYYQNKLPD